MRELATSSSIEVTAMRVRILSALCTLAVSTLAAAGCGTNSPTRSSSTPAHGGSGGGSSTVSSGGASSNNGGSTQGMGGGVVVIGPTAGSAGGGSCTKVSCTPAGGQYCGEIGDGCGAQLDCGACPGDATCEANVCVGGPSCTANTCGAGSSAFCGTIGDGCGRKLECGACAGGLECANGVCVKANCVPLTCAMTGGKYCGTIGDGCGKSIDCGECEGGATCGGGGTPHVCGGAPGCVPVQCMAKGGGQYCGVIGSGCGGSLDCGACADGKACGADGVANVCPGTGSKGCTGLACKVDMCPAGSSTTVTGTVYDPAGVNPIYNAVVYVPNEALADIPTGASCDRCGATASGNPITNALTDTQGRFKLENVPTGANIPLVIQVGKWRRQVTIPNVASCATTNITDKNLTRLPKNQSEGHIPLIAMSTGGSDALECLLRRIGIEDSEFTTDTGKGRVHMYLGGKPNTDGEGASKFAANLNGGAAFPNVTTLWSNTQKMKGYDILVMSCEGSQYEDVKDPYKANMKAYLDGGGRTFASHLHFDWFEEGPAPFPSTATWIGTGADLPQPSTGIIDTTFPKGAALADWLVAVAATPTRGQIELYEGQHSVAGVNAPTQSWIQVPMNPNEGNKPSVQYLTFATPVEQAATPANQCGRVVFTDLHVGTKVTVNGVATGGDGSDPATAFPGGCKATPMSPQAKALEFMFFDLSSCLQSDKDPPVPPPIPPPTVGTPPPAGGVPPPPPPR